MNRHCEQCSKVLKDRMAKSRRGQARFCSRKCTALYVAANRLTATLTEDQESRIVQLKLHKKMTNKEIAEQVGCTLGQVRYIGSYWTSHKVRPRIPNVLACNAHDALAAEIAAAKAEMATAKPFKVGLLGEW